MIPKTISRRTMLKGLGATLALPLLEAMQPRRVIEERARFVRQRIVSRLVRFGGARQRQERKKLAAKPSG